MTFTKRKFLSLPLEQQHKKCAELLRIASLDPYDEAAGWMGIPPLPDHTVETLSDRYHLHAKEAGLSHKEHNLPFSVRRTDRDTAAPSWGIAIYLDNLRSAHNVGSILRTVEAFALGAVHFSTDTPPADHKQVKDAAMGAAEWVTCFHGTPLHALPRPLIAMETADGAAPLYDYPFPDTFTLAIGNEEYGCSKAVLAHADAIIEIPLRGRKNSLNAANAFAIAASEIARQRSTLRPLHG